MHVSRKITNPKRRQARSDEVEHNRIRKLLVSEYSDFLDTIIVESPFAETNRNGRGIRQVSLGLSPSKLIVAADIFKSNSQFYCPRTLDPSIESFELVSVYPLQCVTLSIFSRRQRKTLKARFIDGRVTYYELGGIRRRTIFWKKWCEQVENLLVQKIDGSSLSETTAASSSSSTTLYILSSEIEIKKDAKKEGAKAVYRVWTHYGGAGDYASPTWPQKDVYLGPSYNELSSGKYAPVPIRFAGASLEDIKEELKDLSPSNIGKCSRSWPACRCSDRRNRNASGLCDVLFIREHNRKHYNANKFTNRSSCPCNCLQGRINKDRATEKRTIWYKEDALEEASKDQFDQRPRSPQKCLTRRISRFGMGVPEKCHSSLVLGPTRGDPEWHNSKPNKKQALNFYVLMESGVKVWEGEGKGRGKSAKTFKHFRRYGLCTAPHFLHALGPWSVQPGERTCLQGRRSFSLVTIRRQAAESELRLPVSRRQLAASISYTGLQLGRFGSIGTTTKGRVVLFWTPEFWYRPRPAAVAYKELRQHLSVLRYFRQGKERPVKRKLFYRKKKCPCEEESFLIAEEKPSFLERIFAGNGSCKKKRQENREKDSTIQLRRSLRMDFKITIWDIDSSTLAKQLTLIDRDLFIRIPTEEIEVLVFQRSSRNAPNLGAWIAFSHRISCLTTSEILAIRKLDIRSRIIARFINAASKCFAMGNFHSCRSILTGLQAPPIYRLRNSWSYLRHHHANRYETMERLCKIYKNPCKVMYRRAWAKVERNSLSMPYVGDLISRVLSLNEENNYQEKHSDNYVLNKGQTQKSLKDLNLQFIKTNQDSLEQKQGLGKRMLLSVLCRMKCKKTRKEISEEKDLLETLREQELAIKYFYRWNKIVLKRKASIKEEERLKNMDPRMKRVLDIVFWLADCQKRAQRYDFPEHTFTREFLLKTRYREDRENFFISLKLERSRVT